MPSNGTIDAVFILIRIQEEYIANWKKLHMCFVDQEKAFDGDLRKAVEWAMRRNVIPEALVRAVMRLYKGTKKMWKLKHIIWRVCVNVWVHQRSYLSPLLFAIVFYVAMNRINVGMLQEIMYANDIMLRAEIMAEQQASVILWKVHLSVKTWRWIWWKQRIWWVRLYRSMWNNLTRNTHVLFEAESNGECSIM